MRTQRLDVACAADITTPKGCFQRQVGASAGMSNSLLRCLKPHTGPVSAAGRLTIDTPVGTKRCVPIVVLWQDGTGPFFLANPFDTSLSLRVLASGQPVEQCPNIPAGTTTFTWSTNITAGMT
ncbi:hypothetical protein C8Q73DRAFT_37593 [Cubamyces lactineus]|nr:hypothetical protein C8Q73DRAFT_37593 [Cubamyces lactineus]